MKKMSLWEVMDLWESILDETDIDDIDIDWSDLWIIDFRHLNRYEREGIFLVTVFEQVPYLVRVLFARYGEYEGCKLLDKLVDIFLFRI